MEGRRLGFELLSVSGDPGTGASSQSWPAHLELRLPSTQEISAHSSPSGVGKVIVIAG